MYYVVFFSRFYTFNYLFSLFCATFAIVTAAAAVDPMKYTTPLHMARAVFEILTLVYACLTFVTEVRQLCRLVDFRRLNVERFVSQYNTVVTTYTTKTNQTVTYVQLYPNNIITSHPFVWISLIKHENSHIKYVIIQLAGS